MLQASKVYLYTPSFTADLQVGVAGADGSPVLAFLTLYCSFLKGWQISSINMLGKSDFYIIEDVAVNDCPI